MQKVPFDSGYTLCYQLEYKFETRTGYIKNYEFLIFKWDHNIFVPCINAGNKKGKDL